jgi:hypothetical protein
MSTDQCAQNPNGSFKDTKEIQWFYDKDDAEPLPLDPSAVGPSQALWHGLCNKATNRFMDAVAREQLGSDEEDLYGPPRCKHIARASGSAVPPAVSPAISLKSPPPMEGYSDNENNTTFPSDLGSESSHNLTDNLTDLELISNNEV